MKRTLKHTITALICVCLLVTGIGMDAVTADASDTAIGTFENGGSVTMNPGDMKRLLVTDESGNDITENYRWSSSDTNVIIVSAEFVDDSVDFTECLEITAKSSGTAIITGKSKGRMNYRNDITMTVTVKFAEATTKQKKCRHSWKTTKKASCQRVGIKTCKKCRLQKETKTTDHAYVTKTVTVIGAKYFRTVIECFGCGQLIKGELMPSPLDHDYSRDGYYDWGNWGGFPKDPVFTGAYIRTHEKFKEHCSAENYRKYGCCDADYAEWEEDAGPDVTWEKTLPVCKYCGYYEWFGTP